MQKKVKRRKLNAVQKQQESTVYTPVIRSRGKSLSQLDEQLIRNAFLINEKCVWELTSNCKVLESRGRYVVRLLKRSRPIDKLGKRVSSCKFTTAIDA